MPNSPRIVLFAYSEAGCVCLESLLHRNANVVALFSHENVPGENIWFRSVANLARRHGVPVFTPPSPRQPPAGQILRELRPELLLSCGYRRLIPEELLQLAPLGAFNLHESLLPKYRGQASVNWAVLKGETQTGATLHHMVERADAGDIVDQEPVSIGPEDSAMIVLKRVQSAAVLVLERQLPALLAGNAPRRPQDESQATYFRGCTVEDGRIDWRKPTGEIFNLIRALTRPFPGAFADVGGARLILWWARPRPGSGAHKPGEVLSLRPFIIATGDGALELTDCNWVLRATPTVAMATPRLAVGRVV